MLTGRRPTARERGRRRRSGRGRKSSAARLLPPPPPAQSWSLGSGGYCGSIPFTLPSGSRRRFVTENFLYCCEMRYNAFFDLHTSKARFELKAVLLHLWRVNVKTTCRFNNILLADFFIDKTAP